MDLPKDSQGFQGQRSDRVPTHKHTQEIAHDVRQRMKQKGDHKALTVGIWPELRDRAHPRSGSEFGRTGCCREGRTSIQLVFLVPFVVVPAPVPGAVQASVR